ncbi:MAG: hypothetical protein LC650_05000 [Actinobacteria bacterium]|nr:hypothetical protein [Actinomycetota bacterium]
MRDYQEFHNPGNDVLTDWYTYADWLRRAVAVEVDMLGDVQDEDELIGLVGYVASLATELHKLVIPPVVTDELPY